jgi:hypothetical protein
MNITSPDTSTGRNAEPIQHWRDERLQRTGENRHAEDQWQAADTRRN